MRIHISVDLVVTYTHYFSEDASDLSCLAILVIMIVVVS